MQEKRNTKFNPIGDDFGTPEDRSIKPETAKKYKVHKSGADIVFPIFKDGKHVGNKSRLPDRDGKKIFRIDGEPSGDLFGQAFFPPGSAKSITITEGEYDAMSVYELTGSLYPCVSVLNGASGAERDVVRNLEYLNSFPEIVINFDSDEPGQAAAQKVASLFEPKKVRLLRLNKAKDANEYLKRKAHKIYTKEWYDAPQFALDGLKLGTGLWDEIWNRPSHFQVDYPFAGLNRMTYGIRLSELVVLTAETGRGKTSVVKEIEYALLADPVIREKGYGIGFMHLEEPNADTAIGLMSVHNNKPYHLPDTERTEKEMRDAFDAVINTDRVVIWDHFGSNNIDAVLDKVRHMHALGCKYIVLDHLSIVVSDQSGDERKQLDEITTKLKTLCMQLNIALIVVIHQNRQGQIRGTAGVEQLANIVIKLHRDTTDPSEWRRNVTKLVIEKNRFCGKAGPACYLFYDENTGRLNELTREEVDLYEAGGQINDDAVPF